MGTFVDDLKSALSNLDSVKADIEEIHKCKAQIQSLKEQIYETVRSSYYLRDDRRIVISAPEIIIGNVDHTGMLLGEGGSTVIVRGNDVELQAAGSSSVGGTVTTKAASIRQIAVDPGRDGLENMVCDGRSEIVSQAKAISIRTDDVKGAFVDVYSRAGSGVVISSDTGISLDATPSNKIASDNMDSVKKSLDDFTSSLKSEASNCKSAVDSILDKLKKLTEDQDGMTDSETNARTNYRELLDMQDDFKYLQSSLCSSLESYIRVLGLKAESSRRADAIGKMKDDLGKKSSDFKTKTTGSYVSISSERVSVTSRDGDGNLRENKEAGLSVQAPFISVTANDKDGKLIKDSSISFNYQKMEFSTANTKLDEKKEKGDYLAEGDITVYSKNFSYQSIDRELKDDKITEKALTKDGTFSIRAENVSVEAADTEGKSAGKIKMNAKNIQVASMDLDKEKRTDKSLAASSQMVLLSEKMFTGSMDKEKKSKLVQVVSDKVAIIGDTTAEMQQGEAKAVVTLDGGNFTAGGSKNELDGDTTIKGKTKVEGDVEGSAGGKFKSVEASSQFKSPSISDGMGAAAGGSAGKPSAKLKMEEAKKEEQK